MGGLGTSSLSTSWGFGRNAKISGRTQICKPESGNLVYLTSLGSSRVRPVCVECVSAWPTNGAPVLNEHLMVNGC